MGSEPRPGLPSRPTLLALDCAGPHCAVALLRDGAVGGAVTEPMERGQAERLMPMIGALLAAERVAPQALDAVAVGIGPGSFTGIRIAVATARGLALGLGVPAVGVSAFEVLADGVGGEPGAPVLACLPGPRGSAYLQPLRGGRPDGPARQADPGAVPRGLARPDMTVIGWEAEAIGRQLGMRWQVAAPDDIPSRIARIAGRRLAGWGARPAPPAPLYVRGPDADPPREGPPVLLGP